MHYAQKAVVLSRSVTSSESRQSTITYVSGELHDIGELDSRWGLTHS